MRCRKRAVFWRVAESDGHEWGDWRATVMGVAHGRLGRVVKARSSRWSRSWSHRARKFQVAQLPAGPASEGGYGYEWKKIFLLTLSVFPRGRAKVFCWNSSLVANPNHKPTYLRMSELSRLHPDPGAQHDPKPKISTQPSHTIPLRNPTSAPLEPSIC